MAQHLAAVQDWLDTLWARGDTNAIARMRSTAAESYGLSPRPLSGAREFELFYERVSRHFTDMRGGVEEIVENGDRVAARLRVRAVVAGKEVTFTGAVFATFADGRLQESYNLFDVASIAQALGLPAVGTIDEIAALLDARS